MVCICMPLWTQTHMPDCKTIIGIWKQSAVMSLNGNMVEVKSGNYKIYNADSTYYTIVTKSSGKNNGIGQYGTYQINSSSILTEHILKHGFNSDLDGTDLVVQYKLIKENTLFLKWQQNERWFIEKWIRMPVLLNGK